MFYGLHSSFIHFVSKFGYSSLVLSSVVNLLSLLEMRMLTPPPFFSSRFFPIHLYPLILILLLPESLVSEISAIPIFFWLEEGFQAVDFAFNSIYVDGRYGEYWIFSDSLSFFPCVMSGLLIFLADVPRDVSVCGFLCCYLAVCWGVGWGWG